MEMIHATQNKYLVCEECQELTMLKEAGISIYRYKLNIGNIEEGLKAGDVNIFVVLNTRAVAPPQTAVLDTDTRKSKCKRCQYIATHAHSLLKSVDEVERQHVTGICDHCRGKSQTKDVKTLCDELVAKYLVSKGIVCKCHKIWGAPTGESRSDTDLNRNIRKRFIQAGKICQPSAPGEAQRFRSDESMIQTFPFETDDDKARNKYLFPEDIKKKREWEERRGQISSVELIADMHDRQRQEARRREEGDWGEFERQRVSRPRHAREEGYGTDEGYKRDEGYRKDEGYKRDEGYGREEPQYRERAGTSVGKYDRDISTPIRPDAVSTKPSRERGEMERGYKPQREDVPRAPGTPAPSTPAYGTPAARAEPQRPGKPEAAPGGAVKESRETPRRDEKLPAPPSAVQKPGRVDAVGKTEAVSKPQPPGKPEAAPKPQPPRKAEAAPKPQPPGKPEAAPKPQPLGKPEAAPKPQPPGKVEAVSKPQPLGKPDALPKPQPPGKADKTQLGQLPPPPSPTKGKTEAPKKDEQVPPSPGKPQAAKPEKVKEGKEPKETKESKTLPVPPKPVKPDKKDAAGPPLPPKLTAMDKKGAAAAPGKEAKGDQKVAAPAPEGKPAAKEGKEKPPPKEKAGQKEIEADKKMPAKGKIKILVLPKFKDITDIKAFEPKAPKGKKKAVAEKPKEEPKEEPEKKEKKEKEKGKEKEKEREPVTAKDKEPLSLLAAKGMKERELRGSEKEQRQKEQRQKEQIQIKTEEVKQPKALEPHKKKGSMILKEKDIKTTIIEPTRSKPKISMLQEHLKGLSGIKNAKDKDDISPELKINEIRMASEKNTLLFSLPQNIMQFSGIPQLPLIPRKYLLFKVTEQKVIDKKEGSKFRLCKYDRELFQKCLMKKKAGYPPLTRRSKTIFERRLTRKFKDSDLELEIGSVLLGRRARRHKVFEAIKGLNIVKNDPSIYPRDDYEPKTALFKRVLDAAKLKELETFDGEKSSSASKESDDDSREILRYRLSDRKFIDKGWTMLPTEKILKKMHVYKMRPSQPEFDWFKKNKDRGLITYDTGERLAEIDQDGRGRLYYKNNNLALDYYDSEEMNAHQRIVIYSSGEKDDKGRSYPITVLAMFDFNGNGIVFDHAGKIRLKYNQTEGVVLDRDLGPVTHWKWHSLNDPPVLQQVMIDTYMAKKDPEIIRLGLGVEDHKGRPQDDEDMLAIEFDNFVKEKTKKLSQSFKPYQIRMKSLRINNQFSLKVIDQATVNLLFQDGTNHLKLNLGMVLDHHEIIDTKTVEINDVENSLEVFPAKTDSLEKLQADLEKAKKTERLRSDREKKIMMPLKMNSIDQLTAALSRPRPVLRGYPNCTFLRSMKPVSASSSTV